MNIGFDYDGCLDDKLVQDMAEAFVEAGHNVYVLTHRHDEHHPPDNDCVWRDAASAGIIAKRVIFCGAESKQKVASDFDLDVLYDDSETIVHQFNYAREHHGGWCRGILVNFQLGSSGTME